MEQKVHNAFCHIKYVQSKNFLYTCTGLIMRGILYRVVERDKWTRVIFLVIFMCFASLRICASATSVDDVCLGRKWSLNIIIMSNFSVRGCMKLALDSPTLLERNLLLTILYCCQVGHARYEHQKHPLGGVTFCRVIKVKVWINVRLCRP